MLGNSDSMFETLIQTHMCILSKLFWFQWERSTHLEFDS